MATIIPITHQPATNVEAAYEDMFKEITRKLYGEETGNGLHTLGTPVAHVATSGPTAPEGERSFTTLMSDRSLAPTIEYEHNNSTTETTAATAHFKTEDHLTTAFGLAALMQNGFTSAGAILNPQSLTKSNANITGTTISSTGNSNNGNNSGEEQQHRWTSSNNPTTDQLISWATAGNTAVLSAGKLISYSTTNNNIIHNTSTNNTSATGSGAQKLNSNKSSKIRIEQAANEIFNNAQLNTSTANSTVVTQISNSNSIITAMNATTHPNTSGSLRKNKGSHGSNMNAGGSSSTSVTITNNNQGQQPTVHKRYHCAHCPYSTDRRDLYTRHENIHKDEKPFQCYACLKQFNRADHVKKHFLRMHRELTYDINKTRRPVSNEQKPNTTSFSQHSSTTTTNNSNTNNNNSTNSSNHSSNNHNQQHQATFLANQRSIQSAASINLAQAIESVATAASHLSANTTVVQQQQHSLLMKQEKVDEKSTIKVKREKRFSCCYCPWTGADKWGLKRHLNTHTKPFVCMLCDYKAARSERLATHVLKVHNKKACNKCSFLADNQEDYQTHMNDVHQLKMDAISRNTASVAQDFHNAGGVVEPTQSSYGINSSGINKCKISQPKTIAEQNFIVDLDDDEIDQASENNEIYKNNYQNTIISNHKNGQRKAMSVFYNKNNNHHQMQLMRSPPAYNKNNVKSNKSSPELYQEKSTEQQAKGHRFDLTQDKENSNSIFAKMEYQNLSKFEIRFQNYIKEIINKYYAETPLLYSEPSVSNLQQFSSSLRTTQPQSLPQSPTSGFVNLSENDDERFFIADSKNETESCIEYLRNKSDITLTVAPKTPPHPSSSTITSKSQHQNEELLLQNNKYYPRNTSFSSYSIRSSLENSLKRHSEIYPFSSSSLTILPTSEDHERNRFSMELSCDQYGMHRGNEQTITAKREKRNRKQAQPKKIAKCEIIIARLRDKYLKKLVDRKKSCVSCTNRTKNRMLFFAYHSPGSLAFHRLWRHFPKTETCSICHEKFSRTYSLKVHKMIKHKSYEKTKKRKLNESTYEKT